MKECPEFRIVPPCDRASLRSALQYWRACLKENRKREKAKYMLTLP